MSLLPERPLVLLVEDDRDGRLLFAEWLQQPGFRVEQAHNGLQALERAFDLLPDAILTDLNIPGIDGYELTRTTEAWIPRTEHIPVLAVTGYAPFTQDPVARGARRLRRRPAEALPSRRPGATLTALIASSARTAVGLIACRR